LADGLLTDLAVIISDFLTAELLIAVGCCTCLIVPAAGLTKRFTEVYR